VWSAPFVARIVRAGVGVSLGTSSLVLAPAALGPVPVAAAAVAADDEPVIMRDLTAEAAPPEPAVAPAVVPAEPAEWAVQPGDSFWRIAESSLASAWGRPPTDREIDPYWRGLIAANRDRLTVRDNPDLLVPGQMLRTPAVPARP
jgi:nucleoid-associated protein YgaU